MPTTQRKARHLLKDGKAKIVDYKIFTIQLTYPTGETKQKCALGIDTGSKHIGFAIISNNKVLLKGEIELRNDVKELLQTRKTFRRSRRNRKTRYRKCRFLNRKRKDNWLPPSIESKIKHTINWINKLRDLVPDCRAIIEVGNFDIQKIVNPEISGKDYQNGELKDYNNVKAFILFREQGQCQLCKQGYNGERWNLHHIIQRKDGGSDSVKNLALLHESCHSRLHKERLRIKKNKEYKDMTIMNITKNRMFTTFPLALFTYGCYTQEDRVKLSLSKTHYNDAIAITGIKFIKGNDDCVLFIKQVRSKKRSLHEATPRKGRKEPNITSKRNSKNTKSSNGFNLNEAVIVNNRIGFITGFTNGGAYVRDKLGNYITLEGKSYKQISFKLIKHKNYNNNWQFIPHLKKRDFLPKTV